MLLLHGHLGNENVMWIFARKLPKDIIMLAPRAPQQLGPDQYSWHAITPRWPDLRATYADLTAELLGRVDQLGERAQAWTFKVMMSWDLARGR